MEATDFDAIKSELQGVRDEYQGKLAQRTESIGGILERIAFQYEDVQTY